MGFEESIKVKKIALSLAFLICAGFVFNAVTKLCEASAWDINKSIEPWSGYSSTLRIHSLAAQSLDVAAFGGSTCATSFSPMDIWDVSGITSHNYGGSWQSPYQSYYLLKEVLKVQNPKVVFLEAYQLVGYQPSENTYRLYIDPLPLSKNKIAAIINHIPSFSEDEQTKQAISYFFSINKYHQTWKALTPFGFTKKNPEEEYRGFYGFVPRHKITKQPDDVANFTGFTDTGNKLAKYLPEALAYTQRMVDLCKQKDITFVLYKTPHIGWTEDKYNAVQAFADQNGITYIDFNRSDYFQEAEISFATMFDDNSHMNITGGIAVSRYLGDYLRDNYDLPGHKAQSNYADWDTALIGYQREVFNSQFVRETNMSAYLDLLTQSEAQNLTAVISVRDNCQAKMGDEILGKLRDMGFESDTVFEEYGHSFIGIWQKGKVIYEAQSETIDNPKTDAIEYKGVFSDETKYYVKSAGYRCGDISNIIIDGAEKSKNSRGFNIVVFDNITGRVVDSVCWDTHKDAGITFKR